MTGKYPFFLGDTKENLFAAAKAEKEEWEITYKQAAEIAYSEGFDEISELFNGILEIEKHHAHRFMMLAENLKLGTLLDKEERTQWVCRKCGHILISKSAPDECPVCGHPKGYFEIFTEKF